MDFFIKNKRKVLGLISFLGILFLLTAMTNVVLACGWDNAGGQGFMGRGNAMMNSQDNSAGSWGSGSIKKQGNITKQQAEEIVTRHIASLNPDLKIGNINDTGRFFEAEIISPDDKEILQIIGVNKRSGDLKVLN